MDLMYPGITSDLLWLVQLQIQLIYVSLNTYLNLTHLFVLEMKVFAPEIRQKSKSELIKQKLETCYMQFNAF